MDGETQQISHQKRMEDKRRMLAELRAKREADTRMRGKAIVFAVNGTATPEKRTEGRPETMEDINNILAEAGLDPSQPIREPEPAPMNISTDRISMRSSIADSIRSLALSTSNTVDIKPKSTIAYQKTTQTDDFHGDGHSTSEFNMGSQEMDFDDDYMHLHAYRGRTHSNDLDSPGEDLANLIPDFNFKKLLNNAVDEKPEIDENKQVADAPPLQDDEKKKIMGNSKFGKFFFHAAKVVDRAMCEPNDFTTDYAELYSGESEQRIKLVQVRTFNDQKWTHNRSVTGITMNQDTKDLFAVSYDQRPDSPDDAVGVIVVWNLRYKSEVPEFIFTAGSRLTSVSYARFSPHLVLGGCYTGQICVWDARSQPKKTPAGKSGLIVSSHTQPVFNLFTRGAQNATQLFSVSTDGKVCTWNTDNVQTPFETKELSYKKKSSSAATVLAALSIGMPSSDANYVCVGCEDGKLYRLNWLANNTENDIIEYEGHKGSITILEFNRCVTYGGYDFGHLFLTSSVDWTVKLWSIKDDALLYKMEEHADFVMGVAWSPVHPGVFASVDASGRLLVCNLSATGDICVADVQVTDGVQLTKIRFSENGDAVLVGDGKGNVFQFSISGTLLTPDDSDYQIMDQNLKEWRRLWEDEEMDRTKVDDGKTPAQAPFVAANLLTR